MASETVTWIDPTTGASHVLDGSTTANPLCFSRQGFNMPPVAQVGQRVPLQPGTIIRYTDVLPRPVTLGLNVNGNGNETTLRQQLRTMTSVWFPPGLPGVLRNTAPDGVQRDLNCYYIDGLPLDETYPNRKPGSVVCPLALEAADPFWYDSVATTLLFSNNNTSNSFLGTPFLPLTLGGNFPAWTSFTITNSGDFETWPLLQVMGPVASALTLVNNTSGKAIKLTANGGVSLAQNEVLTIDTYNALIYKQDGSNQMGFRTTDSSLWSLVPGVNAISITGSGFSTPRGSAVQVTFKQRHWSV